jgi:hypothetical protein
MNPQWLYHAPLPILPFTTPEKPAKQLPIIVYCALIVGYGPIRAGVFLEIRGQGWGNSWVQPHITGIFPIQGPYPLAQQGEEYYAEPEHS